MPTHFLAIWDGMSSVVFDSVWFLGLFPSRFDESHFWRHNSYSLRRQGLIAVFEATRPFCRDRIDRQLGAHSERGWGDAQAASETPPTSFVGKALW
jgi:hypothetical protein